MTRPTTRSYGCIRSCVLALTLALASAGCGSDTGTSESGATTSLIVTPTTPTTIGSDGAGPTTEEPAETSEVFGGTVVEVDVAGGQVDTADSRIVVRLSSSVRLIVTSDIADEVHIHGIDEHVALPVGQTVIHDFVASIPGVFEVELEEVGQLLFSLEVQP